MCRTKNHQIYLCKITINRSFQKSCIDFTIQARPLERYMPKERNSVKYKIWRIVVSTPFEYFIMGLIVLNTVLLMMKVSVNESLLFPPKKSPLFLLKMNASRGKSDEFSCDRAMLTQDGEEHRKEVV